VLKELCGLLDEQKGIIERLLGLSQEKQRIIINGESALLEDIVRKELRVLSELNATEKKRPALNRAISAELKLPEAGQTLSSIAERAEPGEAEAIRGRQAELAELIDRHSNLNKQNQELIKAHLEYSEMMLNLIVGPDDPLNNLYGGDGKSAPIKKKSTGFFDGHA